MIPIYIPLSIIGLTLLQIASVAIMFYIDSESAMETISFKRREQINYYSTRLFLGVWGALFIFGFLLLGQTVL